MHGKDKIDTDLTINPSTTRSEDALSTVGRPGPAPAVVPGQRRLGRALRSTPLRLGLAAALTCGLGGVAVTETRSAGRPPAVDPVRAALADRAVAAAEQPASRSTQRAPVPSPSASPTAKPKPKPRPKPKARPARPARPRPVAGLTQAQMDNAAVVVRVGRRMGIPRRGLIVAIATTMQESDLYNLASDVVPESLDYPHQGSGADHDSVGLFQQRPSSGWGSVADLMQPAYAAQQFFLALAEIPDWQDMSVTLAAQTVQVSAFPDAYAQHEDRATTVVDALL
ncbi:hypothetical protein ACFFWC_13140 [Plantactinospora siamensis]|uniref:Peptidase M23 n=1 Tax=Plantactinospora siamensis TaxID=555372 RepID=A0ABV6P246_9ACTN